MNNSLVNTQYKISVVIPTYNRSHVIVKSLLSVINQTVQPFEILVVDDYSTDDTEIVVNSINSPLVKLIKNNREKGANGARNSGIIAAKGDFIAFHDSDDIWIIDKLQMQIEKQKEKNYDMVFCKMIRGDEIIPSISIDDNNVNDEILKGGVISTQLIYIKSDLAKKVLFDEKLMRLQDWEFAIRLIKENIKIGFVPDVLVKQINSNSSITTESNILNAYAFIFSKHKFLIDFGLNNKISFLQSSNNNSLHLLILKCVRKFRWYFNKVFTK